MSRPRTAKGAERMIDRRTWLRYSGAIGLTGVAGALGTFGPFDRHARAATPKSDAVIRVANLMPVGAIDPLTASDPATICLLSQTGEYLLNDDGDARELRPALALSWSSDETAQVWTFQLRPGVRFHNGAPMTAKDVVATFNRLTDPQAGSAALSVMRGVLSHGAIEARGDSTVVFHLDAPNGNFPYYVSSDNYNAIILPAASTQPGAAAFETHFIGSGPFRLASYTPRAGARFVRNTDYWGEKALPESVVFTFFGDQQSQILALQAGDADIAVNFSLQGGRSMLHRKGFRIQAIRSSSHRQVHMRCDAGPFADARVRRALALAMDRESIVNGIFLGHAQLGNDSPFAPVFPSSPTDLPQRHQDLAAARALLQAAGKPRGFSATLVTEKFMEMPDYAVLVQNAAKAIGIDLELRIEGQASYYGSAVRGSSDWLDSTIGITDYGHRGVPNVFLNAPLTSHGAWNAARYADPVYDALLQKYTAARDLENQRDYATKIGARLLDQTPVIVAYFFDALLAMRDDLQDVTFTAITQLSLARARFRSS